MQEIIDRLLTTEDLTTIGSTDFETPASTNHSLTTSLTLAKYGNEDCCTWGSGDGTYSKRPCTVLTPHLREVSVMSSVKRDGFN